MFGRSTSKHRQIGVERRTRGLERHRSQYDHSRRESQRRLRAAPLGPSTAVPAADGEPSTVAFDALHCPRALAAVPSERDQAALLGAVARAPPRQRRQVRGLDPREEWVALSCRALLLKLTTDAYSVLKNESQRKDYNRYLEHLAAAFPEPIPPPKSPPQSPLQAPHSSRHTSEPRSRYIALPPRTLAPRISAPRLARDSLHDPGLILPRASPPRPTEAEPPTPPTHPPAQNPNYKYLFDDEAGRIRRWVDKVVEMNDRRARKYDGWRRHRLGERGRGLGVHAAPGQLVRETAARTRAGAQRVVGDFGDWTLRRRTGAIARADERESQEHGGRRRAAGLASSSWQTARGQSGPEPTWTELMGGGGGSGSSSSSTSLPSGSSSSFLAPAPASAMDDGWTLTPSMSPSQGGLPRPPPFAPRPLRPAATLPRDRDRQHRHPTPYPSPPRSAGESISAVRETLRQCGDTPITRMIAVELDKLEHAHAHAGAGVPGRYVRGGKVRIFLVVLRTLLADGARRRWRQVKGLGSWARCRI